MKEDGFQYNKSSESVDMDALPIEYGFQKQEALTKGQRLQLFYDKLRVAPPASTEFEALSLISILITEVEDQYTNYPNTPDKWQNSNRIYPPQSDARRQVENRTDICRYRTFGHDIFIGQNGSIKIYNRTKSIFEFEKAGSDDMGVII